MKRIKAEAALGSVAGAGGEQGPAGEGVVLDVRGGEVALAVPRGTSEDQLLGRARRLRGELRLENERVLTIDVDRRTGRASFQHAPVLLHDPASAAGEAGVAAEGSASPWSVDVIMTRQVLTASPDELVEDVAKRLAFHEISGMPVEDWDGRIIGIVSELDVMDRINETIRDAMSNEVISVSPGTPIDHVGRLMAERRIKRVPVLEGETLVGIVSRADVVRAFAQRWAVSG